MRFELYDWCIHPAKPVECHFCVVLDTDFPQKDMAAIFNDSRRYQEKGGVDR